MKKVLLIIFIFLCFLPSCKKYEVLKPINSGNIIEEIIPGNVGDENGPLRISIERDTVFLYFSNAPRFVIDYQGERFWQYRFSSTNNAWSNAINQIELGNSPDWGMGILIPNEIPEEEIIQVRYRIGSYNSVIFNSKFYNATYDCLQFQISEIEN